MLAQSRAFIIVPEQPASLQFGNDFVDKIVESARQVWKHYGKTVGGLRFKPFLHFVSDALRRTDQGRPGIAAKPLRKLSHGQVFPPGERDGALPSALGSVAFGMSSGNGPSGLNFEASWPSAIDNDAMALA